ncbi:ABC transporter permease [Methanobacterium sp.]|jgi:putative ABC transport system permease protein|uniref:ABC transporter permease n=1 Tax=Methanobacterium sp. TaxID=2164 RepID=UPI0031598926
MNYLGLIIKNPFRNKTRTSLAIVGIAIGIATIVALGLVTSGLQASTQSTLKAGAAEITVTHTGSNEFGSTSGSINESRVANISNTSGVKEAAGILRATTNIEGSSGNGLSISGIDSSKLSLMGVDSINGTIYSNGSTNEIILGKTAAEDLNKSVGDNITIFGKNFKITGIFETGSFIQDAGAFMPLNTLQNLTSNDGKISTIAVKVTENANVTEVSQHIEDEYPNELSTVTAADQAGRINDALGAINTATWAISLLAIVIGGVGVINTMIMSVYERTREIGVLKAVGWRGRRILGMILGESIVLTIMAAIVGTIIGVVGVEVLLSYSATFGTMIKPVFSLDLFLRAFGIAFLVGIIGGIYPAYRASRLAPTEALRYE